MGILNILGGTDSAYIHRTFINYHRTVRSILDMILAPTVTTRRGKQVKNLKVRKMAEPKPNAAATATPDDEPDKEITLRDTYKSTLSVKTTLTSDINTQRQKTEELEDENTKLQQEVKEQDKLIRKLTERVLVCEAKSDFQRLMIEENREEISRIDAKSRRHNLIIYGIPEEDGIQPREQIKELFDELGLPFGMGHTDAIYRIGPKKKGKHKLQRPIYFELIRKADKGEVLKRVSSLKNKPKWKRVSIGDDLTPELNRNRQDLRDLCALARREKIDARLSGNMLIIDNKRFLHKDINNLPHRLKLKDAKQVRCKEGIAFQGPATYLSNLHRVPLVYEDLDFSSVEQAFVYMKALICGALAILSSVRSIEDPFRIKSLSRKIVATKEWEEQRDQILYEIIKAKFKQNQSLADALIATQDLILFEATRDSYFGCGLPLSQSHLINKKTPGKNICGEILMQVREELILERQEIVHLTDQAESESSEADQDTQ